MNTQAPSLSVSAPGRSHSRCQVHQERYNQENRRYIHTSLGCFLFVLNNEHQSAAKQWQYSRHGGRGRPSARTPHPLPWPTGSAVSTGVLRADVTILAVFNRGLGQEVANEVDSLCKAGRQRRELIPCFWPAMDHKGLPPRPPRATGIQAQRCLLSCSARAAGPRLCTVFCPPAVPLQLRS